MTDTLGNIEQLRDVIEILNTLGSIERASNTTLSDFDKFKRWSIEMNSIIANMVHNETHFTDRQLSMIQSNLGMFYNRCCDMRDFMGQLYCGIGNIYEILEMNMDEKFKQGA